VEMVTTVALEMEEKRRKEEWEKTQEENKDKVKRENIFSKSFFNNYMFFLYRLRTRLIGKNFFLSVSFVAFIRFF
jgi:hypothetical protein